MKGLLIKDFINLKKNFRIFGVLSLFYIFLAFTMKDADFFSSVFTMLFAILTLSLFSYDDMAKWDIYALTMPVSRESMVQNKYFMMLFLTLIGTVFSSLVSVALNIALKADSILVSVQNSLIGALIVILLYSIILPFIIKMGVEKARFIFFIIIFVPFAIISFVNTYMKNIDMDKLEKFSEIIRNLMKYSYIVLPLVGVFVLGISYRISVGIYRKKEF